MVMLAPGLIVSTNICRLAWENAAYMNLHDKGLNGSAASSPIFHGLSLKPCLNIYSGYGKYSRPFKFFTLCFIAAIC